MVSYWYHGFTFFVTSPKYQYNDLLLWIPIKVRLYPHSLMCLLLVKLSFKKCFSLFFFFTFACSLILARSLLWQWWCSVTNDLPPIWVAMYWRQLHYSNYYLWLLNLTCHIKQERDMPEVSFKKAYIKAKLCAICDVVDRTLLAKTTWTTWRETEES